MPTKQAQRGGNGGSLVAMKQCRLVSRISPHKQISLSDLRFFHHLGASDIDSVFLVDLKSSALNDDALFDTKVMDKKELASHNKEGRESFVPAAIFMFSSGGPKIE
ncbi:hypothetical protein LguiA_011808 [Lonicera macranthoides]